MNADNPAPAVTTETIRSDIVLIKMDLPGTGANILNDQLFAELDQTMATLMENRELRGVILYSAKPKIFVAGADLNKINATLDWPDKEIIRFCEKGRAVMARFSRCPFVSVAAIHGACVGGGLELALWCDCRIATNDRRTILGLPEVNLGLVPGWAGTARLPRLAGFEAAAELVTSGSNIPANRAAELGFVDLVVSQDRLLDEAVELIGRVHTSEAFIRDRKAIMGPVDDLNNLEDSVLKIGKQIVANEEVYPFAPTVALEHMARTASLPIKEAWDSESLAMAQVYGSPASRGLLNHFFLVDRNKKQPGLVDLSLKPKEIATVGIVGAGLMGQSIAQTCVQRGLNVILLDAAEGKAQSAVDAISGSEKATLVAANDFDELSGAQLIIETVVETFEVKKSVLPKIESAMAPDAILASNTSAIPIEKLASTLSNPERFCGIHFCHPELMSLVEVVCGPGSSEQTVADAVGFVRTLRKMPIAINDGAGFVVNRLLAAMIDQSLRLYANGYSIECIDQAMREFGFKGGPFEIIDVIGVDTCMYAGRTMWEHQLDCVSLSPILPRLVKSNRLGRKMGAGFYKYSDLRSDREWDPDLPSMLESYRVSEEKQTPEDLSVISDSILAAVTLEASKILDEEIVADYRDIDLAIIHGFSFPKHRGGILFWADQVGLPKIRSILLQLKDDEPRLAPSELIQSMADQANRFYNS